MVGEAGVPAGLGSAGGYLGVVSVTGFEVDPREVEMRAYKRYRK